MDPLTLALILGAAFWVTDTTSSGLLRAEVGGGISGAFGGAGRKWWERRKTGHERRAKRRSKSRFGRMVNAVLDEVADVGSSFFRSWPEGRRRAHERRRARWEKNPPWWKRFFGPSDPEDDDPEKPEGEPETFESVSGSGSEGSGAGNPEGSGARMPTEGEEPEGAVTETHHYYLEVFESEEAEEGADGPDLTINRTFEAETNDQADKAASAWAARRMRSLPGVGFLYWWPGDGVEGDAEYVNTFSSPSSADGQPAAGTATRGSNTVATDLTTAPAVIKAWEEIEEQIEELDGRLDELATDAETVADGSGDFAVGSESDTATAFRDVHEALQAARERIQAILDELHEEWDGHIQAAEGGTAEAHAPFQEV